MEILAIRLKNLASLEGITEIDFTKEPLLSAGIFAITGPTGAGKSTILDALCLALYAKTPRYTQAKELGIELADASGATLNQNDVRGILRDGSTEGFAAVDFLATDGERYRATWAVKRSKNKVDGNLQAWTLTLKNLNTGSDIAGKKTELLSRIEQLVGLNFEQFTRSVLLAQNDFTAFLKAGKDEKSSLLEKLTGTHIYSEISKRVFERNRQEDQQLNLLQTQSEGIPSFSPEELTQIQAQRDELTGHIHALEAALDTLNQEWAWVTQATELTTRLEAAQTALLLATEAKAQSQSRAHKLSQVEAAQPLRTLVDRLDSHLDQSGQKQANLNALEVLLDNQQQELSTLNKQVQIQEERLQSALESRETASADLAKARELDVRLQGKQEHIKEEENRLVAVNIKAEQHQLLYQQKQEQSASLAQEIQNLKQWKADNTQRQPVAENQNLLLSKLKDATHLLHTLQPLEEEIIRLDQEITQKERSSTLLQQEIGSLQEKIKDVSARHQLGLASLDSIPIASLLQDKETVDQAVGALWEAGGLWNLLYQARQEKEALEKSMDENQRRLAEQQTQEANLLAQKEEALTEKNTAQALLDKARLTATKGAESLRAQLAEGVPCPVCGSLEHPYAHHNPLLNEVLLELEKELQQRETVFHQLVQMQSRLQGASSQLQILITRQQTEINNKAEALTRYESAFQPYHSILPLADLRQEQIASWIQEQLETGRTKQTTLSEQIKDFNKQKEELETLKKQWDTQQEQESALRFQYAASQHSLTLASQRRNSIGEQKAKASHELSEIKSTLDPYFSNPHWFKSFQEHPEPFTESISRFAEDWKRKTQALDTNIGQLAVVETTLSSMQVQQEALNEAVSTSHQQLDQLKDQYNGLLTDRNGLFNGEPVTEIEGRLKSSLDQAQEALNRFKSQKEAKHSETLRSLAEKDHLMKDLEKLAGESLVLRRQLQDASPLTESALRDLLAYSSAWIQEERLSLAAIDKTLTESESVMKDRRATLHDHLSQRSTQRSAETLRPLLEATRKELEQQKAAALRIDFSVQQDKENKRKIGTLLGDIEVQSQIAGNWARLSEVIGSADGKKFRQIAQEYTLDVLLQYANIHLATLSKRYVLQRIDQTLGLQVMDQDMGNEIRTVYSLSGGESFLVSLALALGLASLSSNRMKVGSLFIDEGFGSLDPNTLNVAMDALERLQHQGRCVGVISHVQEMTERIPVQIRINKEANGKSRVDIQGIYP